MKISHECIPCLTRQAVEIAEEMTNDKLLQEEMIKKCIREIGKADFAESAPEIAFKMHRLAREITGINDPYEKLKEEYNQIAKEIYDRIVEENWIENAEDSFDMACRLAIAGNIIDFSVGLELTPEYILKSVEDSLKQDIFGVGSEALKKAVAKAQHIMYIADNSGEIVFDKFLIKQMPLDKITYVVKGGPIVNDATMQDAISSGVADLVRVLDNGHSA